LDFNNNICFEGIFADMDGITKQFLAATIDERLHLLQNEDCLAPKAKVTSLSYTL
jgi:hypothetical protein